MEDPGKEAVLLANLKAKAVKLEAFFHAKYFLEMACKYGRELAEPPETLPSGWAALLCLYGMR